jgi:hypothetical protein
MEYASITSRDDIVELLKNAKQKQNN